MKALIIGSHALRVPNRKPVDHDMIIRPEEAKSFMDMGKVKYLNDNHFAVMTGDRILDLEIAWPDSTGEALLDICESRNDIRIDRRGYARSDINVLYALKMSHRYKKNSPHFEKTRNDILYMRSLGAYIDDQISDWYHAREAETLSYGHPSLNKDKSGFFAGDGIEYYWDHDSIHEAVCYPNPPAYTHYMKDGAEVMSCRKKFAECSEDTRLRGVYEESMVLAFERSIWPNLFVEEEKWKGVFRFALQKVCTSITSGWFREFAWENYDKVLNMYDPNDMERVFEAVRQNRLRRHVGA